MTRRNRGDVGGAQWLLVVITDPSDRAGEMGELAVGDADVADRNTLGCGEKAPEDLARPTPMADRACSSDAKRVEPVSNSSEAIAIWAQRDHHCQERLEVLARPVAILTEYLERGGNLIDTANAYTNGHSEKTIGDYLAARPGLRDRTERS